MKKLYLALLLILLLGFALRSHNVLLESYGEPDSHFHIRLSETVKAEKAIPERDEFSNQGRFYSYPPMYHLSYALLSILSSIDVEVLARIYPILYGLIGVLAVFLFARKLFNTRIGLFSAFFLSTMAYHLMRTSAESRPDGLALLIIPFIIYLIYCKRFKLAGVLAVFQVLLHPLSTMYLSFFLILWIFVFKVMKKPIEAKKTFIIIELIVIVFLLWVLSLPYPATDYVSNVSFESSEMQKPLMMEFFTLFSIAWAFMMIGLLQSKKKLFLLLWFGFSFAYAMFGARLGIFVSFPAAILAGVGFNFILEKVKDYKKIFYFLVLLLCLLALVPGTQNNYRLLNEKEINSMEWIKEFTNTDSNIMSVWDRGHPLTRIAERKVIMDGYFEFAPDLAGRNRAMKELVSTSDCSKIYDHIHSFNINYFYLYSRALHSREFILGVLEAKDCYLMNTVFENDGSKIIKYDLESIYIDE